MSFVVLFIGIVGVLLMAPMIIQNEAKKKEENMKEVKE